MALWVGLQEIFLTEQGVHFLVRGGGADKLTSKTPAAILVGPGVQRIPSDLRTFADSPRRLIGYSRGPATKSRKQGQKAA